MTLSVVFFFGEKKEDLWEHDYIIDDLLSDYQKSVQFLSYSNLNNFKEKCDVFVYSCRNPNNYHWGFMPTYHQVLETVLKLEPKIIIQVSDEFESEDNNDHNNLANYCDLFLRNYHHSNYQYSKNTLHIPIGRKNDFEIKNKKIKEINNREYNWSFIGQQKSDRKDMLINFSNINNNHHLIHEGDKKLTGDEICNIYLNSVFVPCPRGWTTLNTMRIYEASICGAIPVIVGSKEEIEKDFAYEESPPFIFSNSWKNATIICKNLLSNESLLLKKQKLLLEWWNNRINKIKNNIKLSLESMPKKSKIKSIIQVGSNFGNDDLANYIKSNIAELDFALFVEANSIHIPSLKECYKKYPNAVIKNIAIKPPNIDGDSLTIYYHTNDGPRYEISSCDINHIHNHVETISHLKGGEIKSFIVPCITLEELFQEYNIQTLDWLLLDVEGIDSEILLSFDWKKYKIKRIEFEYLHLKNKEEEIKNMLINMGYMKVNSLHEYDWAFELKENINKLDQIPNINCITLKESEDRRQNFIEQFKKYNLEHKINFHFSEKFGEVAETLEFEEGFEDKSCDGNKSIFVAHLKNIKNWYENTDEEYALFCEDDLSLDPVEYWNFSWKDFIDHLPSDWECVQLSYTGETLHEGLIRLQKRRWYFWGIQAFLVKRSYAKKLLDTYYRDNKIIMIIQDPEPYYYKGYDFFPNFHKYPYAESLLLRGIGNVYAIPLFAENVDFPATFFLNNPDFYKETQKPGHFQSYRITMNWWKEKGYKKEIKELMTMIKIIDYFPYFNETGRELLNLRVNLLKDHVDQFIICESNKTHSGVPTPRGLRDAIEYYNLPKDKIRIIDLDIPEAEDLVIEPIDYLNCHEDNVHNIDALRARVRERMQKDALLSVLDDYDDECMIIHSDSDEIVDPKYIQSIKNTLVVNPNGYVKIPLVYLESSADLRVHHKDTGEPVHWATFAANRSIFKKVTPIRLRSDNEVPNELYILYMVDGYANRIEELGWHFSWMGNKEKKVVKAKSFAHYTDELSFLSKSKYDNYEMEDEYEVGSIPPCGNVNYVLKEYPLSNLPSIIVENLEIKDFFLPTRNKKYNFSLSQNLKTTAIVCENFYEDPYSVREYALSLEYEESDNHRGKRTLAPHIFPGTKEKLEQLLGKKITNWTETYGMCGRFQYCTAEDALVYHSDVQQWAAVVYLTPDAPYETGTSLLAHKKTRARHCSDPNVSQAWQETAPTGLYLDGTPWDEIDKVANVFNRLIIWDGHCPHSASKYFGFTKETSRLFQIFFFDTNDAPSWVN